MGQDPTGGRQTDPSAQVLSSVSTAVSAVFRVYEEKRRARVDEMHKAAERNGNVLKKDRSLGLWLKELVTSRDLGIYDLFALDKLGLGQKAMAYNIEEDILRYSKDAGHFVGYRFSIKSF
ncbi:hypothetical protein EYZ11_010477 [Aspergillus tanneri]|uniref:Uncharacterized protein n=1 Tax=Aspergillus tanneri TaxID=1220188 RepID=A0A4S3JAM6_9EURO|nr:hypothetical protein EYZ11_010477 [Aspergillus tanneri]